MYQFSRRIYRELAPEILERKLPSQNESNQQRVLNACETAMERLATDRRYFTNPTRTLFKEIRIYFPMNRQLKAYKVIESYMTLAIEFLEQQPETGLAFDGTPLRCRATTRKGKPCQRMPLPSSQYCPSHQHLEEPLERVTVAA